MFGVCCLGFCWFPVGMFLICIGSHCLVSLGLFSYSYSLFAVVVLF